MTKHPILFFSGLITIAVLVVGLFITAVFGDLITNVSLNSFAAVFASIFLILAVGGIIGLRHDSQLQPRKNDFRYTKAGVILISAFCALTASSLVSITAYLLVYTRKPLGFFVSVITTSIVLYILILLIYGLIIIISRSISSRRRD